MSRDQDSSKLQGEDKVAYAKEALAESITLLGAEVEVRLKHAIDHAYDRAETVTRGIREGAQKTRDALDVSRHVRARPKGSFVVATLSGFAVAIASGRKRRQQAVPMLPPAQLAAALAAPKQQLRRASLLGSFAGSLISHLADYALEAAFASLARRTQGVGRARTDLGLRPDMH